MARVSASAVLLSTRKAPRKRRVRVSFVLVFRLVILNVTKLFSVFAGPVEAQEGPNQLQIVHTNT